VPKTHPVLEDERAQRRLGGQIFTSEKAKVVDVLVDVFPQIQDFVASKLPQSAASQPLSNGHAAGETTAPVVQVEDPPAVPTSILA
jgi:histone deacetylase 6